MYAESPIVFGRVVKTAQSHPISFGELAETMLEWAEVFLGETALKTLVDGYTQFVIDVNRGQAEYEVRGAYEFSSTPKRRVACTTTTSSCLRITGACTSQRLRGNTICSFTNFSTESSLEDFDERRMRLTWSISGSGSGIWSLLTLRALQAARSMLVDVSQISATLSRDFICAAGYSTRATVLNADALRFKVDAPVDAAISCFLLEHLENPRDLLSNLGRSINDGGIAFVTTALTAAETDHIFEFVREGDVVDLAEDCGFRVLTMLSADPGPLRDSARYLPRSMAMVLQKRRSPIW